MMILIDEWCHLTTTGSLEDLHAFASTIGVSREAFLSEGHHTECYLLSRKEDRTAAVAGGAIFVPSLEQAGLFRALRRSEHDDGVLASLGA